MSDPDELIEIMDGVMKDDIENYVKVKYGHSGK